MDETEDEKKKREEEKAKFESLCKLMKDILGDNWTSGLGLHKLSRNGGIQALLENGAGMGHLTAAAGFNPSTADEYATGFNTKKLKAEAHEIKRAAYTRQGLLKEAIQDAQEAITDLADMLASLKADAAHIATEMTGEEHKAEEMPVALYDVLPNGNGGFVSIPSEVLERRRERDLNSRIQRKHDFQSRAIPGYAISAYIPPT